MLWSAVVTWDDDGTQSLPFPDYCKASCECLTEQQAQAERSGNVNQYDDNYEHLIDMDDSSAYNSSYLSSSSASDSSSGDQSATEDVTSSSLPQAGDTQPFSQHTVQGSPDPHNQKPQIDHEQCGNSCASNSDCSVGQNKSCICSTQSEQYQPSAGTVAFVAACIMSLSGKRAESAPCPCNSTYVSHACCVSEDGNVWEAGKFKLGELL